MPGSDYIAFIDGDGDTVIVSEANPLPTSGGGEGGGGGAVTVADGAHNTFGAKADAVAASDTATATFMSKFTRALQHLTSILGGIGTTTDAAAASGNGTLIALIKQLRTLLDGSNLTNTTATISSGQSLSAALALSGVGIFRISVPTGWDAANLTFQVSVDNVTYYDLYKSDGSEYVVTAAANRAIVLNPSDFASFKYIKIRSGTVGTPVAQSGARSLVLATRQI